MGSLGMVFGNVAIAPLYTVNLLFFGGEGLLPSPQNIYGCIGLIIWTMTIMVSFKYFVIVFRALRGGEGGPLILWSFLKKAKEGNSRIIAVTASLLLLSVGFFIGDGMAIPGLSFLSALDGLRLAPSQAVPSTAVMAFILVTAFFLMQSGGSDKIGRITGIFVFIWLAAAGLIGLSAVMQTPEIINALNPVYILIFITQASLQQTAFIISSVVLSVAGAEIMYVRLGSTRKWFVYLAWFCFVYPLLILSYLGQGAYLLSGQLISHGNIFYSMVPQWAVGIMSGLAIVCAFAASQAWISSVFSLIAQAVALQVFPRIKLMFTAAGPGNEVFVPGMNWFLYLGAVIFLLMFRSTNSLASVYGAASSAMIIITTVAIFVVAARSWRWKFFSLFLVLAPFFCIETIVLGANLGKTLTGGYVALEVAFILFGVMKVWEWGRRHTKYGIHYYHKMTMKELIHRKIANETSLPRSVIVMTPKPIAVADDTIPAIEQLFIDQNGLLPKNIIFLTVNQHAKPYTFNTRYRIGAFYKDHQKGQIVGVEMNFGSREEPDVVRQLSGLARHRLISIPEHPDTWLIHVLEEHIARSKSLSVIKTIAFRLYTVLEKNSIPLGEYYGLGGVSGLSSEFLPAKIHTS